MVLRGRKCLQLVKEWQGQAPAMQPPHSVSLLPTLNATCPSQICPPPHPPLLAGGVQRQGHSIRRLDGVVQRVGNVDGVPLQPAGKWTGLDRGIGG